MANKHLLTAYAKITASQQLYYSPVVELPQIGVPLATIYCFLSKVDPWDNESDPVTPTQDQKTIKQVFKNMFVAKQIYSSDMANVIERIDWTSGTTYDYYRDDVDMFAVDTNGSLIKKFYVKNKYDQVFKCLWNANGAASTNEPYFEPGSYGTNNIYQGPDGYKWKYMYTIDSGLKIKFMDKNWIPVPIIGTSPNPLLSSAGAGDIEVINVLSGGSGYDTSNSVISVSITGDGTGATATANVVNGVVRDIIVTNPGTNYTYANASIVSTPSLGSGCSLIAPTSPIAGHGFDAVGEFGVSRVMVSVNFSGSENGVLPTDIDFHQLGIVINPTSIQNSPYPATGSIYKTSTDLVVAPGFGTYAMDEVVYQGNTLETATFTAKVLSFDVASNVLKLINITGTPTTDASVFGNTSKTARTLLNYSVPDFQIFSGYIVYIENRSAVQRSSDGTEQFKFVLGY